MLTVLSSCVNISKHCKERRADLPRKTVNAEEPVSTTSQRLALNWCEHQFLEEEELVVFLEHTWLLVLPCGRTLSSLSHTPTLPLA